MSRGPSTQCFKKQKRQTHGTEKASGKRRTNEATIQDQKGYSTKKEKGKDRKKEDTRGKRNPETER